MNTSLLQAQVTIKGTRPFLYHRFTPKALGSKSEEVKGTAGNNPDEWKRTVWIHGDQYQLCVDSTYIYACLREGAKYTRRNRSTLQSVVSATLQVTDSVILLKDRYLPFGFTSPPPLDDTQPVYLDVRGVRNPTTRARNVRYRVACATGWECTFHITWDKTLLNREQMEAISHDSGKLVGLGDGRNISFGRFEVLAFQVQD